MKIFAFRTRLILFSIIQNFLCYAVVNLRLPPDESRIRFVRRMGS